MNNRKPHRTVVLHPGANAQVVKRLQGVAHATGRTLFVAMDIPTATQLCLRKRSEQHMPITLVYPRSVSCPELSATHLEVQTFIWDDLPGISLPQDLPRNDTWHGIGNPLAHTHMTSLWLRALSHREPNLMHEGAIGWAHLKNNWDLPLMDLIANLKIASRKIRIANNPTIKAWIDILKSCVSSQNTMGHLSTMTDGFRVLFSLELKSQIISLNQLASKLQEMPETMHLIATNGERITVSGAFSFAVPTSSAPGLVIIGHDETSSSEHDELEEVG